MMKSLTLKGISFLLFVCLVSTGLYLARHKPLWNDEIYTQVSNVEASYGHMISGRISEGNNTPLFYMIQNGICKIFKYKFSAYGKRGWYIMDQRAQVVTRIAPNVCVALTIVLIFYYFTRNYSFGAGVYSFLVSLSSTVLWSYWAEARPYALWILLTTIQLLIFLSFVKGENNRSSLIGWFMGVHFLMAITAIFSLAQIVIVSGLLWLLGERRWREYILLTVIPCIICLFYYLHAPRYRFWFDPINPPLKLITTCVPKEQMIIFGMYAVVFFIFTFIAPRPLLLRGSKVKEEGKIFFGLMALMFAAAGALLIIFKMGDTGGPEGFAIASRYFVYLTPVGIIAVTLFSIHLCQIFKENSWMRINLYILFGGLLILRFLKTYLDIHALALYWN